MLDLSFFNKFIQANISVIPVKLMMNDKKGRLEGKFPCVSGWQEFCDEFPCSEQVLSWKHISSCSGVAIVCGEASNIGCIDIDTTDPELIRRILDVIPYSPCRILGDPLKLGGKILYRLTDSPFSYVSPNNKKQKVNDSNGNTVADIFYGNGYVVIPPSIHNQTDGVNTYYKWFDRSIEQIGVDNLPVLPLDIRYKIEQVCSGQTKRQINLNLSDASDDILNGRHERMVKICSNLIRQRLPPTDAIAKLVSTDEQYHKGNLYFLDKTKGFRTPDKITNALGFYSDILSNVNSKKEAIDLLEVPKIESEKFTPHCEIVWGDIIPIESKKELLGDIDETLCPTGWYSFISDVANANGVSKEVCLYYLLTQISSLIGNKRTISLKHKNKSWEEAHNIWTIYVSPSGTRKSQVTKTLSFPLEIIQKYIDEDFIEMEKEIKSIQQISKIKIKELKKQLEEEVVAGVVNGENLHSKKRIEEISDKISDVEKNIKPATKRQLIIKGVTVEKLIEIIAANRTGSFLEYNELSQLTSLFKKKGYEVLRTFLMDSWDGLRPYSYQTKGSGEIFIEKNCTSMFASVQNSVFEKELAEISMGINDDGFYQRSFIILNDNPVALAIDEEFKYKNIDSIKSVFQKAFSLDDSDIPIQTSEDAYDLYMQYEQRIMDLAVNSKNSALGSFWSKFTGKTAKLASLIEFIETRYGSCHKHISYQSMLMAIKLMERQVKHIEKMFPDTIDIYCNEIIRAVKFGSIRDGIKHSSLTYKFRFLNNPKIYDKVIMKLYDYNYLSCLDGTETMYYFNPQIRSE